MSEANALALSPPQYILLSLFLSFLSPSSLLSFIFFFFTLKIFFILLQLFYNVVLVSGVQQSDSVIRIHIFIPFSYRLSQNIEFPELYSPSLQVIYLIYSSVFVLIFKLATKHHVVWAAIPWLTSQLSAFQEWDFSLTNSEMIQRTVFT